MSAGDADEGLRRLVRLSASLACRRDGARSEAMDEAAGAVEEGALEAREVEEALLQSYLFLGFPAALEAVEAWRERSPGPVPEEADPLARTDDVEAWSRRGREVCGRVYGRAYGALREKVEALHPALDRWMVTEGYGKVLGRPGLDLVRRELCVAALLAVDGRGPQLHSHLRGALNAGACRSRVEDALAAALPMAPDEATRRAARDVWRRVRLREDRRGS